MDKRKITRIGFIADESIDYFISLFVTGTFLGYLVDALGFNDAAQGIINSIPTFALFAQLLSMLLSGRRVKGIVTSGMVINQLCFIFLYMLPIFNLPSGVKSAVFVILLVSANLINNAIKPSRLVWLMRSVDDEKRGRFTAVKEMISLAGGAVISMSLGALADTYRDADGMPMREYYVICIIAIAAMMIIHTVSLVVSNEEPPISVAVSHRETLRRVMKNTTLFKLIPIDVLWHLATAISAPFFASYLREELDFPFMLITVITTVGLISRIVASPIMGRIADKRSFSFVMLLCIILQGIAFIGGAVAAPGGMRWAYLIYSVFSGFAMAGLNSGLLNLVYDYVSPADRSAALGVKNAAGGLCGFLGTVGAGAILAKIQEMGGLTVFGVTLYAQQLLSVISLATIPILIIYMLKIIIPLKKISDCQELSDV